MDGGGSPLWHDHPWRELLTNEVHARPSAALRAPLRASHLAFLTGETAADSDRAHLAALCRRVGAPPPSPGENHHDVDGGTFRLRWERHTEFSTYTVFRAGGFADPFAEPAVAALPRDWWQAIGGERLVAVHVAVEPATAPRRDPAGLLAVFGSDNYVGSEMSGGAATAWTDFRIHGDGFGRILIRDSGLAEREAGRLVQRLLEIETYRMMALLALPVAREVWPQLSGIDARLAAITARLAALQEDGAEGERGLLAELTGLAALNERIANETNYRFGASRAYHALVGRRTEELRERRIEGLQTIAEFMERRLAPAMRTCDSVGVRLEALSQRVTRASNLLRTRVDIALEEQNRDLLRSMDRRARLQMRLQEAVESVGAVAICYYLLGLVAYALKGAKAAGLHLDAELAVGAAVPMVALLVWGGMHRIRSVVTRAAGQGRTGQAGAGSGAYH
ncbi:MAG TPA: DUF3422 domain-containing protein [Alphaproteobacteria bacterium]|nr:DUF3422 domain-containing protein [Alphaproteobacteria bacterium]